MANGDITGVHRAIATQLAANIARDWNFAAFPYSGKPLPCIEVWPDSDYIQYFATFGSGGVAEIRLRLRVEVATADAETTFIQLTDVLSTGTGETSSIPDAINTDKTLGGVVRAATVLAAEWPADDALGNVAWVPVRVVLNKSGAAA
jgi:hypothetical protein